MAIPAARVSKVPLPGDDLFAEYPFEIHLELGGLCLLDAYPQLTSDDIKAAIAFAADSVAHHPASRRKNRA